MRPLTCILLLSCRTTDPSVCDSLTGDASVPAGRNVLVIISDDIGVDKHGAYGVGARLDLTPNIDALAQEGVLFRNAYGSPNCSPSRASLLTGRLPTRTGVGHWIFAATDTADLELDEVTIPEMLQESPYRWTSAEVGKWHVVAFPRESPTTHVQDQGFDCAAGSLANPLEATLHGHFPRSHTNWEKTVDGTPHWSKHYMTTDTVDEALARLSTLEPPWFLYVATNDAHDPNHVPPNRLRTDKVNKKSSELELYEAMVQAADTEIGRLLDGLTDEQRATTTIVYLSDNGTPPWGIREPLDRHRSKGTIYEGGVHLPMIVTGPYVEAPGTETDALVHLVDLLPTVAEIAEVDPTTLTDADGAPLILDGQSLLPWLADPALPSARETLYTEGFWPNGDVNRSWIDRMVRDEEWKLVWKTEGDTTKELFHLDPNGFDEGEDLHAAGDLSAEAEAAEERLTAVMIAQISDFSDDP